MRFAHRLFFAGTTALVWMTHRPVLRQAGYGAGDFLRLCLAQYAFYLEPVNVRLAPTAAP
jgi:hypothetical protein